MDPALIKGHASFLARARSQPVVEKRKNQHKDENNESLAKKQKSSKPPKPKPTSNTETYDYKTAKGSSQYKFSVLAKIVKHMKTRHQKGYAHPLNIEEILDETKQLDLGSKQRHWLVTEALINNPKIEVVDGNTYIFKPKYNIRNKKGLMNLLKNQDLHGLGGVLIDDIEESIPNAQKSFKILADHIIFVVRPIDKKKILFYNDKYCQFKIDEDFRKMWRSVTVEGLDEQKIEEYLEKQGISLMPDVGVKRTPIQKRKKLNAKKSRTFKKHNDHLQGVLEDYSDLTNKQK
ncbi:transcription initiation factor IIE subunit beta [Octopus bimaculoides]|uniref:Transcription initiation factor IIE subunit beta n=1 Tax=Octopus bimaculoides TaxID=37653 RepID=A0A0L8IFV1_OCTBM|nr:transcription initiation factor IIE subunit beta [Octopus bimaculoides]|eukprot:XP_014768961.1 PREDICTED: transcription initiation factor IIE subunit beta-like [Octopus bimaculoides]